MRMNNMKGRPEVIASLNERLSDYHASLMQNVAHSAVCAKFGYSALKDYFDCLSKEDYVVIFKLNERITFLDGVPDVNTISEMVISETSHETLLFASEHINKVVGGLSSSLDVSDNFKDRGTRRLLEDILVEEEKRLFSVEAKMNQFTERGAL